MKILKSSDKLRLIWRSLWIQVLLNYKTMQGAGYLYILWPWLKNVKNRAPQVRRTSGFINGHPVFSAFAIGAMLRRLSDGDTESNSQQYDVWRESLAGPLGMVGDALIWERWKPIVLTLGIVLVFLLQGVSIGTEWYVIPIILVLAYNVPLLVLRWWALGQGFERGNDLLTLCSHPALHPLQSGLDRLAAIAAALIAALVLLLVVIGVFSFGFFIAFIITFVLIRLRVSVSLSTMIALTVSLAVSIIT